MPPCIRAALPGLILNDPPSTEIYTVFGRTTSARKPLYAAQKRLSAAHQIAARLLIVGCSFPSLLPLPLRRGMLRQVAANRGGFFVNVDVVAFGAVFAAYVAAHVLAGLVFSRDPVPEVGMAPF